jgi:plastocyanin
MRSAWAAALGVALAAQAAVGGELRGRVGLELPGARLADFGPVVVYLEAADGARPRSARPELRQHAAQFTPGFLAVAVDEPVSMPNDDDIFHNVFSFSSPNDFDLGLYPAGESRTVRFEHPGVVKVYCSIHEGMSATIFVAPTPLFAVTDADGRYAIADVPPARYRVRTWAEKLPDTAREVAIGPGVTALDLRLGEKAAR